MFDKVTITYRGAKYEIGRGRDFYGIWITGASRSQPLEWWPETPEGWSAAWTRFASIEAPGAIVPVGRRTPPVSVSPVGVSPVGVSTVRTDENPGPFGQDTAPLGETGQTTVAAGGGTASYGPGPAPYGRGPGRRVALAVSARTRAIAAAALGVGVILGVAGLFPAYLGGASLAQQADQLIPHAIYLAVWTASAALILLGGARLRPGALLGLGLSVVTFGLFFADAGTAIAGGGNTGGAGLVLALVGWLACAAGSVAAFLLRPVGSPVQAGQPGYQGSLARPRGAALGPVVMLVLAGLGVAAAFAPAWDSFTLRTAAGQTQSLTAGNAFSNPGLVIAGDVAVMLALAAVVIVAGLWRPVRHGAVLLAGAAIPMAAQAISALVQAGGTASPAQFGISSAEASQIGLTISSGLTPAFWIYCGFLVALTVSCAWMLFTPQPESGPRPSAGADAYAYAWAGPRDDLTGEETDDDTDTDTDDVVTADFETAPSPTEGGARYGASPAA
ncbi:MAG: hypothetical protein ACRDOH_30790 [Streptosporangiaceae bacterium]